MLSMVVLLPSAFGLLIWRSYRVQRASGKPFQAPGKLRWPQDGADSGGE
jgi:hypothetical protein